MREVPVSGHPWCLRLLFFASALLPPQLLLLQSDDVSSDLLRHHVGWIRAGRGQKAKELR